MGRLYCKCLNAKIGHNNSLTNSRVIKIEQLCSNGDTLPKNLTGKDLIEIQLDLGGVLMEHPVLSHKYSVNDWKVHHCTNCATDVFISHSIKQDKVFVFKGLIEDPTPLINSPNYSSVFSIVLGIDNDNQGLEEMPRKRLSSMNYGNEDPVLKVIHNKMKSYLNQQEEQMEQRIKKFQEEQRRQFTELQRNAHEERRRLFIAIHKSRETGITEAMVDHRTNLTTTTSSEPESKSSSTSPVTMGFDVKPAAASNISNNRPSKVDVTNKSQTQRSPTGLVKQQDNKKELDSNVQDMLEDDDGLFTFDEEMKQPSPQYQVKPTDSTPFGLSSDDDDDSSTDGSSFHDDPVIKRGVPSSLPMAMPLFMRMKEEEYCGSVDDQIDPSEVAKSIQQLALSVQDTGMFGDLPKPRTNSRR